MKDGRDAVTDRLPIAVEQRHIDGKIDAGAGHHLTFERIAMQIDDAWQHQQAAGIDAKRAVARERIHGDDFTVRDLQRGFTDCSAEKSPAAFDENVRHDTALRRGVGEAGWADASYLARKSSTVNFRKSGRAPRSVS